ncbi:MAG: hypothetical protein FJ304_02380 [Planctomycetes bacterium]|nr:hypothetical protein [Planctomycetota bacterium]
MAVRHMRLTIGLFFLAVGLVLLALRLFAPDAVARFDRTRLLLGACMGLGLAGVNLAKWYAGWLHARRAATPVRSPLLPDPSARGSGEHNPDFDFSKKDGGPA